MPRTTHRSAAATLLILVTFCSLIFPGLREPAGAEDALEGSFYSLTNASRSANGLGGLQYDPWLSTIARDWTNTMIRDDVLKHNPSLSAQVSSQVTNSWTRLGENVGVGYDTDGLQQAFMNSPGHRANVVGDFNRVGIGAERDGRGRIWVTVVFMKGPAIAAIAPPSGKPDGETGPLAPSPKQTRTFAFTGTQTAVDGDFNGDGFDDIVWYSPTGPDRLSWGAADGSLNEGTVGVGGFFTPVVGDFNGDGADDIYWFSPHGGDAIYYGGPHGFSATYPNANGDFRPVVGDFNGDGPDDIYWFSPHGGDSIYYGSPAGFRAVYPNANGDFAPLVADFNGDGPADIYWFSPGGGDSIYYGTPGGFVATYPNANGDYDPLVADFNGDQVGDIYWFSPGGGDALYYGSKGGFSATYPNANGGFQPEVGDFDGNGRADILWYAPGVAGDAMWWGTTSGGFNGGSVSIRGNYDVVVGEFDDRTGTDVLFYDSSTNPDALWFR